MKFQKRAVADRSLYERLRLISLCALCLIIVACTASPIFQPADTKDVDDQFDFDSWRAMPSRNIGKKVRIGGRIIQAEVTEAGIVIVAQQLPIVERPAYGPTETGGIAGLFEFAFLYPGKIRASALTAGNRFLVIGLTQRPHMVVVDGAGKSVPYLLASCTHIWETKGREISDFPDVDAGYYPLAANTYCVPAL